MTPASVISIRPSEFVEGGAVPVDRNLTWKESRFCLFDYPKKDGTSGGLTVAARITYVEDDGKESIQHYSAADPERFEPSADGKTLVSKGDAKALNLSSNFYVLMNALVSSGFPESKLEGGDISVLDGLYTYNVGIPEPKRSGLIRTAEQNARTKILSVPSQILRMPGEKAAKTGAKGKAAPAAAAAPEADTSASDAAIAFVMEMLSNESPVTRQKIAAKAIREKQQAVAKAVYTPAFLEAAKAAGMTVDGEKIGLAS